MRPPTNPAYTASDVHPNGSKVHGTIQCKHRCGACSDGKHHWIEHGRDPDDLSETDADDFSDVIQFDRANGTQHLLGFYSCKHCNAWAEHDAFDDDETEDGRG